MKMLNGLELAGFIKERQGHQARALIQADHIIPKLAIVVCTDNPVITTYVGLKQRYGADIGIEVEVHNIKQTDALGLIGALNENKDVHGIIVQLPLQDVSQTDEIVNAVAPQKDVDALGKDAIFDPATPMAIMWLLAGYNVDLQGKAVTIVGNGRLVGLPLKALLDKSGIEATVLDGTEKDPQDILLHSQIIITAVGKPGLINSDMIPLDAVVVDAAVASENGELKGDLADDVYERDDIKVTPRKGGVGPLTVVALFDNVIRAANLAK